MPAHLWLRPARRDKSGALTAKATWVIIDSRKHVSTGCAAGDAERAAERLAAYIAKKYAPTRRDLDVESIKMGDVLIIYNNDVGAQNSDPKKFARRLWHLNEFWGIKMLASVTGATCRAYAAQRGSQASARRELEDLRAAINYHAKEGFHRGNIEVTLPAKGLPRERWLTRAEAAHLIWTCWRAREVQEGVETRKRPLRHLARFILIALYTGTRAGAVATASPYEAEGRSFVDLDRGIYYRLAQGKRATNKRQPPAPIAPRLLAHMRRWRDKGIARGHFVEFNGRPIKSVKTAMASALARSGLEGISPHVFRHTAATWMMQNGAPMWETAGYLGMSEEVLRRVYAHQHPNHMQGAVAAISRRPGRIAA